MITLYLDTSSSFLYIAIVSDDLVLAKKYEKLANDLSIVTMTKIKELFVEANLEPNDINRIVVTNGPGSFTGVRIGVTIAKTYAWSLAKNIYSISSLECMAVSCPKQSIKIPLIDARRGYVYAGIYDQNNNAIISDRYILFDELLNIATNKHQPYCLISNDSISFDHLSYEPDVLEIVKYATKRTNVNPHLLIPNYLKLTEAEESFHHD